MGMAVTYYTADMMRALPDDGQRYELVHGELLVTPAPRPWHQEIVKRLLVALEGYLSRRPIGHVLASPADISWTDDSLVQPDVFVVALDEARTLDWARMKTLLLAVEVLSPSTGAGGPVHQATALSGSGRARILDRGSGTPVRRGVDARGHVPRRRMGSRDLAAGRDGGTTLRVAGRVVQAGLR